MTALDAGAHKWKFIVDGVTHYGGGADDLRHAIEIADALHQQLALIADAIRAVEADDLVVAERWCEEAERKSLRRYNV